MYHTVLITATEWDNFFALRAHPAAEIHIADFASKVLDAMNASTPRLLKPGEWHIPYEDQSSNQEIADYLGVLKKTDDSPGLIIQTGLSGGISLHDAFAKIFGTETSLSLKLKIATARCAQTSYTIPDTDGKPMDYAKLVALHNRLAAAGHWSPFEHCARCMTQQEYLDYSLATDVSDESGNRIYERGVCGNFRGWIQYRKHFSNESRTDDRLIKHLL
jgi:hypothetical protein